MYVRTSRSAIRDSPRSVRTFKKKRRIMEEKKKSLWGIIIKVIIAVATTVAGALGISSCV